MEIFERNSCIAFIFKRLIQKEVNNLRETAATTHGCHVAAIRTRRAVLQPANTCPY